MHELRTAPRQRRSQKSIDAILDAAEELIHERGQVNFTANELSAAAGMSIGRVYYWFPDIPSVVAALVERSVDRLVGSFAGILREGAALDLLEALDRGVHAMCEFIEHNPAVVALTLTGRDDAPGQPLFDRMFGLAHMLIRTRVPDASDAEVLLVARTSVGITLGMMRGYAEAGEHRELVRQELVYVLSAWLRARYPPAGDRAWTDRDYPIRPARAPVSLHRAPTLVYPPLGVEQP
jgi:AcrR family transcriptional regulator